MAYVNDDNLMAFAKGLRSELYNTVSTTFAVDGWTAASGGYTQTKTILKTAASGVWNVKNILPPLTTKTGVEATDKEKRKALYLIANGTVSITVASTSVTVTVTTAAKPTCDVDVIWYLEA
uniref:Uncharacterized protein n=1 Tax=Ackermannviridae sp. TaxID=2831612 RepID=A0A8S5RUH6_9CAUD|nr:MAG TPA: hypothetical protein [Ackermannviridae sp.]DAV05129.1 MAG TPA: hypothetical protein [Caudoviricetes sp.]